MTESLDMVHNLILAILLIKFIKLKLLSLLNLQPTTYNLKQRFSAHFLHYYIVQWHFIVKDAFISNRLDHSLFEAIVVYLIAHTAKLWYKTSINLLGAIIFHTKRDK